MKPAIKERQPARYPSVRLPQSPRKIDAGLLLKTKKPSKHPINNVDVHVTIKFPPRKLTIETANNPVIVTPVAKPSRPSIKLTALDMPTIHKQAKINPTQ